MTDDATPTLAGPEAAPPAGPDAPAPAGRRGRIRRCAAVLLALVLAAPVLLVATAAVVLRARPLVVPAAWRPPPPAPPAPDGRGLWLRYLGISGYEVTDGRTVVLLDPTVTRPTLGQLLTGSLAVDEALVRELCPRGDYVLVNHAHYDHVLDVPAIALHTGATVLGSRSTTNLARSRGVALARVREVAHGDRLTLGTFTVDVRASRHTSILGIREPMSGTIPADAGPLWFFEYTIDATLCYRLAANGATLWFHPTSTYAPGELGGLPAGTLVTGVNGEPLTLEKAAGLLGESRARCVVPTHHDNFFQPLSAGPTLMPGVDLEAARAAVAAADPRAEWRVLVPGERLWAAPD